MELMKLHEKLDRYIVTHGIKQSWIAEQTNISPKTLNAVLKGRQRLTVEMLDEICKALKIEPGIFFKEKFLETKTCKECFDNMLSTPK